MRRATARANLNMNLLAVQDYRNALHIDHTNLECIQEFEKLLKKIEEEITKDPTAKGSLLADILSPLLPLYPDPYPVLSVF